MKIIIKKNGNQLTKKVANCSLGDVVEFVNEQCIVFNKDQYTAELVTLDFSKRFVVASHISLPVAQTVKMSVQF